MSRTDKPSFLEITTPLEYIAYKLLGDPIRSTGNGQSFWPCPACMRADDKFHTMPDTPKYKHRFKCFVCNFRGDAHDLMTLVSPDQWKDFQLRKNQVEDWEEEFEQLRAEGHFQIRKVNRLRGDAGGDTLSSSGESGSSGGRYLVGVWDDKTDDPENIDMVWELLSVEELEVVQKLCGLLKEHNVTFYALAKFNQDCLDMAEWIIKTDEIDKQLDIEKTQREAEMERRVAEAIEQGIIRPRSNNGKPRG